MSTPRDRSVPNPGFKGDSDEVGYGRPPREHQFKPGHSGNPRGRPKGSKNETTILHDLLNRKIEVRQGGRSRKISVLEAILMRFTEDALKGNTKSAAFLFNRYAGTEAGESQADNDISADDREVLDTFARRFEPRRRNRRERP
jgi:hypothetical protein